MRREVELDVLDEVLDGALVVNDASQQASGWATICWHRMWPLSPATRRGWTSSRRQQRRLGRA